MTNHKNVHYKLTATIKKNLPWGNTSSSYRSLGQTCWEAITLDSRSFSFDNIDTSLSRLPKRDYFFIVSDSSNKNKYMTFRWMLCKLDGQKLAKVADLCQGIREVTFEQKQQDWCQLQSWWCFYSNLATSPSRTLWKAIPLPTLWK